MKIAIIDLGTNTFNLLIRDFETNAFIHKSKISVKLGKGGLNDNSIAADAYKRGMDALRSHLVTINDCGVSKSFAFATSAIRTTTNGKEFVKEAYRDLGIRINIISGQEEAKLIYQGVIQAVEMEASKYLIADIGGGSTEFIIADQNKVHWLASFPLGSTRLLEKFKPSDPISESDILAMNSYFKDILKPLDAALRDHEVKYIIGSSGSFDTLADIIQMENEGHIQRENEHSYNFNKLDYRSLASKLFNLTQIERLELPGMLAMRAELLPIACVLINYTLDLLPNSELKLSTFALKEGVFTSLKNNTHSWQEF